MKVRVANNEAVVLFTAKSVQSILNEGGTSSWRLDRNHARRCSYAICTRNANAEWGEGSEQHQSAFLIGKVKDVVPAPSDDTRFLILFSHYCQIDIPDVWQGDRNPVKYATLADFGIDSSTLEWEPMPEPAALPDPGPQAVSHAAAGALTIADAKKGLALIFGVSPDTIEITIRG